MVAWLGSILRFIFLWLDRLVYGLIGTIYNLLIEISETSIFGSDIFSSFMQRIYGILGIFMLFKVSFSILSYIVNPDDFTDKNKGFSKIVSNILITLVLLVATPWIFDQAMEIQSIVIKDNVLGKLVLGGGNSAASVDPGRTMAYETLSAFYHLDTDTYEQCTDFVYGSVASSSDCVGSMDTSDFESSDIEQTLNIAKSSKNVSVALDYDLVFAKSNDEYIMTYIPVISTVAGGFIVLVLISFCFDIAVRSVKLGFMQLIAPVPIISRIDPKKGKDLFDKWAKTCISTYLDLFVRLLAIYFCVFVISQLLNPTEEKTSFTQSGLFVKVFIIIGALMFAKQLPKLLSDILGVKLGDGGFSLNPLKKLSDVPVIGKGAAGYANKGLDAGKRAAGALGGMAWDSKLNTPLRTAKNSMTDWRNARQAHFEGTNFGSRYTGGDAYDNKISKLEEFAKFKSQLKDQADFDKTAQGSFTDLAGKLYENDNTKDAKQRYDDLRASGTASVQAITEARKHYEELQQNSITNGNTETIRALKQRMATFATSNGNALGNIVDFNGNSISMNYDESKPGQGLDYDKINAATVYAQNQTVKTKNSQGYLDAQKAKQAKAAKQQSTKKK